MKKYVLLVLIALAGWQWFSKSQHAEGVPATLRDSDMTNNPVELPSKTYSCDGRTHCSQMTSCAEATYFLRNCPDTKMDGNHDGVPCEQQWCN
ncbi:MAG: excalibur calcium-binding domain-containing protein [Thiobacillaceae bacterium]|nr:excalibur calcium-binding domain-containing protein [Thiobacillaceae bacterium]